MAFYETRPAGYNQTYYHILEDGTTVHSRMPKTVGERYAKPGTQPVKMLPIKFSMPQQDYQQCLANREELVEVYARKKAIKVRDGQGWTSEHKREVIVEMMTERINEPLMKETFFISMRNFI